MLLRRPILAPSPTADLPPLPAGFSGIGLRAYADCISSYGLIAAHAAEELLSRGIDVRIEPLRTWEPWGRTLPEWFRGRLVRSVAPAGREVLIDVPEAAPRPGCLWWTMWESGELPSEWVERLNRAAAVCVPCQWNREVFAASGVTPPLHVVPLGMDPAVFHYRDPREPDGRFVVGSSGRLFHGPERKGIAECIRAFLSAAGDDPTWELQAKLFPDCPQVPNSDPRIQVIREPWNGAQMAEWYAGLDLFLTMAKGEGFGLQPLEAQACGVPAMGAVAGGHAEYGLAYPLPYALRPAEECQDRYRGLWFVPDVETAALLLRRARERPMSEQGRKEVARRMSGFTWSAAVDRLLSVWDSLT